LRRRLQEKEDARLGAQEHFDSLQQEVDVKTKQLKKLWAKVQAAQMQKERLHQECTDERDELTQTTVESWVAIFHLGSTQLLRYGQQDVLQRELKLRLLMIEHFIPPEDVAKVRIVGCERKTNTRSIIPV
jgi:kinesin family protein 3/17